MEIEIKEITEADFSGIFGLVNYELGYHDLNYHQFIQRLKLMISSDNYQTLVAKDDNKVVGFISLLIFCTLEYDGLVLKVNGLAVLENYQGTGIGTRLLEAGEKYARDHQCVLINLNSGLQRIKAHQFYLNRGYLKKGYSFAKKIDC